MPVAEIKRGGEGDSWMRSDHPLVVAFLKAPAIARGLGREAMIRDLAESAYSLINGGVDNKNLRKACLKAGVLYRAALDDDVTEAVHESLNMLALALSQYNSGDPDQDRLLASSVLGSSRRYAEARGLLQLAAVASTNRVTVLVEKMSLTPMDETVVQAELAFSLRVRTPGTKDYAYTQFASANYSARTAAQSGTVSAGELRKLAQRLEQAIKDLDDELPTNQRLRGVARVCDVLGMALDAAEVEDDRDWALAHRQEVPEEVSRLIEETPSDILSLLRVNSAALGLEEVPEWVLEEVPRGAARKAVMDDLEAAVSRLAGGLEATDGVVLPSRTSARQTLARALWRLDPTPGKAREVLASYKSVTSSECQENFDPAGQRLVAVAQATLGLGDLATVEELLEAGEVYIHAVSPSVGNDRSVVIRSQGNLVRFLACELMHRGAALDFAFRLLEVSRGRTSRCAAFPDNLESSVEFVHLTHGPRSTYLLRKANGVVNLVVEPSLTGKDLAVLMHAVTEGREGVLVLQYLGGRGYNDSLARLSDALAPITTQLNSYASGDSHLVLALGGYYAQLPISALLEERFPKRWASVTLAAATSSAVQVKADVSPIRRAGLMAAPNAKGGSPLQYALEEARAVSQLLGGGSVATNIVSDAKVEDFTTALSQEDLVHFSGHSQANSMNPRLSSLLLTDGEVTVDMLETMPNTSRVVTLSSCESAVATMYVSADEYLTVQSSLFRETPLISVACLWRVYDFSAYLFFMKFYSELIGRAVPSVGNVYAALADAQAWLRQVTLAEVRGLLRQFDSKVQEPRALRSIGGESRPFDHVRHWAGFFVMANCLVS